MVSCWHKAFFLGLVKFVTEELDYLVVGKSVCFLVYTCLSGGSNSDATPEANMLDVNEFSLYT